MNYYYPEKDVPQNNDRILARKYYENYPDYWYRYDESSGRYINTGIRNFSPTEQVRNSYVPHSSLNGETKEIIHHKKLEQIVIKTPQICRIKSHRNRLYVCDRNNHDTFSKRKYAIKSLDGSKYAGNVCIANNKSQQDATKLDAVCKIKSNNKEGIILENYHFMKGKKHKSKGKNDISIAAKCCLDCGKDLEEGLLCNPCKERLCKHNFGELANVSDCEIIICPNKDSKEVCEYFFHQESEDLENVKVDHTAEEDNKNKTDSDVHSPNVESASSVEKSLATLTKKSTSRNIKDHVKPIKDNSSVTDKGIDSDVHYRTKDKIFKESVRNAIQEDAETLSNIEVKGYKKHLSSSRLDINDTNLPSPEKSISTVTFTKTKFHHKNKKANKIKEETSRKNKILPESADFITSERFNQSSKQSGQNLMDKSIASKQIAFKREFSSQTIPYINIVNKQETIIEFSDPKLKQTSDKEPNVKEDSIDSLRLVHQSNVGEFILPKSNVDLQKTDVSNESLEILKCLPCKKIIDKYNENNTSSRISSDLKRNKDNSSTEFININIKSIPKDSNKTHISQKSQTYIEVTEPVDEDRILSNNKEMRSDFRKQNSNEVKVDGVENILSKVSKECKCLNSSSNSQETKRQICISGTCDKTTEKPKRKKITESYKAIHKLSDIPDYKTRSAEKQHTKIQAADVSQSKELYLKKLQDIDTQDNLKVIEPKCIECLQNATSSDQNFSIGERSSDVISKHVADPRRASDRRYSNISYDKGSSIRHLQNISKQGIYTFNDNSNNKESKSVGLERTPKISTPEYLSLDELEYSRFKAINDIEPFNIKIREKYKSNGAGEKNIATQMSKPHNGNKHKSLSNQTNHRIEEENSMISSKFVKGIDASTSIEKIKTFPKKSKHDDDFSRFASINIKSKMTNEVQCQINANEEYWQNKNYSRNISVSAPASTLDVRFLMESKRANGQQLRKSIKSDHSLLALTQKNGIVSIISNYQFSKMHLDRNTRKTNSEHSCGGKNIEFRIGLARECQTSRMSTGMPFCNNVCPEKYPNEIAKCECEKDSLNNLISIHYKGKKKLKKDKDKPTSDCNVRCEAECHNAEGAQRIAEDMTCKKCIFDSNNINDNFQRFQKADSTKHKKRSKDEVPKRKCVDLGCDPCFDAAMPVCKCISKENNISFKPKGNIISKISKGFNKTPSLVHKCLSVCNIAKDLEMSDKINCDYCEDITKSKPTNSATDNCINPSIKISLGETTCDVCKVGANCKIEVATPKQYTRETGCTETNATNTSIVISPFIDKTQSCRSRTDNTKKLAIEVEVIKNKSKKDITSKIDDADDENKKNFSGVCTICCLCAKCMKCVTKCFHDFCVILKENMNKKDESKKCEGGVKSECQCPPKKAKSCYDQLIANISAMAVPTTTRSKSMQNISNSNLCKGFHLSGLDDLSKFKDIMKTLKNYPTFLEKLVGEKFKELKKGQTKDIRRERPKRKKEPEINVEILKFLNNLIEKQYYSKDLGNEKDYEGGLKTTRKKWLARDSLLDIVKFAYANNIAKEENKPMNPDLNLNIDLYSDQIYGSVPQKCSNYERFTKYTNQNVQEKGRTVDFGFIQKLYRLSCYKQAENSSSPPMTEDDPHRSFNPCNRMDTAKKIHRRKRHRIKPEHRSNIGTSVTGLVSRRNVKCKAYIKRGAYKDSEKLYSALAPKNTINFEELIPRFLGDLHGCDEVVNSLINM